MKENQKRIASLVLLWVAIAALAADLVDGIIYLKGWHLALRIVSSSLMLICLGMTWLKFKNPN
jgi:hypothetical protein